MPAKRTRGQGPGDGRKIDRAVQRAAAAISKALTKMLVDLPVGAAPEMALERLVEKLASLEAWQLIMDDHDIVEAYYAAVAELPARARTRSKRS
jgi:hypothetical protein